MDKVISLCKRRGFIFPGSEIYGGLANSWDYGPLGAELKKNIKDEWWDIFVRRRNDIVGIDAALIMNPKVWEASGHIANFTDPLIECKKCHGRFREDQLTDKICPQCSGKEFTKPKQFNLMLKTFLGPVEDEKSVVYFRPETAQAMFVDFDNVATTTRKRLPFCIAQMGKAFRNEITPGNFIFRTREFEQMEIEYFIRETEWEKWFDYWLEEMRHWLKHLGVKKWHETEIPDNERAHYSKRTIDIEYDYPFGRKELYGLAYRGDFDLKNHNQTYTDPETQEKFAPHVIEPTWGVDRSVLVAMLEAYHEEIVNKASHPEVSTEGSNKEDIRVVLKFPHWMAPNKVAVLPLSKKPELSKVAEKICEDLRQSFVCDYDETQSIGKRYRRQDEIGTPFCVTVDFDTLKDQAVTVRDRDSMKQDRVEIKKLKGYLENRLK